MTEKVYIVQQGDWDDTVIIGAFLDKEKAEKYANIQSEVQPIFGVAYVIEQELLDDKADLTTPVNMYYNYCIFYNDPDDEEDCYTEADPLQDDRDNFFHIYDEYLEAYSKNSYEEAKEIAKEQYKLLQLKKINKEE